MSEPSFTIGMEEEYLLVDRQTRDLVSDAPEAVMAECERRLEGRVMPEFLQSQIEVGTSKCANVKEAAAEICDLRKTVSEVAGEHGLALVAASTHPSPPGTCRSIPTRSATTCWPATCRRSPGGC